MTFHLIKEGADMPITYHESVGLDTMTAQKARFVLLRTIRPATVSCTLISKLTKTASGPIAVNGVRNAPQTGGSRP